MKKGFLTSIALLLAVIGTVAQEVVGSAGQSFSNANGSVDFTVGEVVITTINDVNNTVTQGFHQGDRPLQSTKLIASDCGISGVGLNQTLTAEAITEAGAMYEFHVTAAGGFDRSIIKGTNTITLLELNTATGTGLVGYGTTYTVEVRQSVAGRDNPYGDPCTVTTAAFPVTKLRDEADPYYYYHIGLDKLLFADEVIGAQSYVFEVYDAVTYNTHEITNTTNEMNLLMLPAGTAFHNQYYYIRVKAVVNGVEGTYDVGRWVWVGTIPLTQVTAAQDVTVGLNQDIVADPVPGTITYEFYFSNYYYTALVSSPDEIITMAELPGTPLVNQWYAVYVRTIHHGPYGNVYSNWGVYTYIYLENTAPPAAPEQAEEELLSSSELTVAPNPFHDMTSIQFELQQDEHVLIQVFDITGKEVKRLVDTRLLQGNHNITWSVSNQQLERGMYLISMKNGDKQQVKQVILH